MAGETEEKISAWTTDTLRSLMYQMVQAHTAQVDAQIEGLNALISEHDRRYQQRYESQQENVVAALTAQKEQVAAALMSADRAVVKAETASEKRFDAVNEFRATLADQAAQLMPRSEAESRLQALGEKLGDLNDRINRSEGKGS